MVEQESRRLKAALTYAKRGWYVFPLHTPTEGGCSCRRDDCNNFGKHPRTMHGLKDAVIDEAKVRQWWTSWPEANIGIACGPSNLAVIDVDPRHGGDEAWRDLVGRYGESLRETVVALTGGGGEHYFYSVAEGKRVSNSSGLLGVGLDVRGDGGYVVAPPSMHASGQEYSWERSASSYVLAPFPDVMEQRPVRGLAAMVGDTIPSGQRDETLTSLAGSMRRRGMGEASILAALREENKRCDPPLPEGDVARIAHSIAKYDPSRDIPLKSAGLTEYTRLRKQLTKPPVYILDVSGFDVRVTMTELTNHAKLRTVIAEQTGLGVARMKGPEWDSIWMELLETTEELPAPEDASEEGIAWGYIVDFLKMADSDEERFEAGMPVCRGEFIYTAGSQLRQLLGTFHLSISQPAVWAIIEAHGGEKKNIRIGNKQRWVWSVASLEVNREF